LEEAGLVRRFHVGPERVGVKLADGLHHLVFSPEDVVLAAFSREADLDVLLRAAKIIWERLRPNEPARGEVNIRFLTPAKGDYDTARREFGDRIVEWPEGIRNVDSALSVDLSVTEFNADLHLEYGIVAPNEAANRLTFHQPAVAEDAVVNSSIFPLKSLPETALYDNQFWRLAAMKIDSAEALFALWSRIRRNAEEIDLAISEYLLGDKNEQLNGNRDS
jgi:hypothetical protein